ncbi:MAG TPA: hypothetical protein VHC90_04855 [Bryobacteraceae bacterium]|nr:hypothetical protein [Bryobacteraceae bacterium]
MIPAQLKTRERKLRAVIARREYGEIGHLLAGLQHAADEYIQGRTDPATRREIAAWMLGTIEWARLMVTAQRQRWAEELETLPRVDRFLVGTGEPSSDVCVDL